MAQATFSLVFDQIHLIPARNSSGAERRAPNRRPYGRGGVIHTVGATLAVARPGGEIHGKKKRTANPYIGTDSPFPFYDRALSARAGGACPLTSSRRA